MTHLPVLLNEIIGAFSEASVLPKSYLDGTFGRGGHLMNVLEKYPELNAVGLDQDPDAISFGEENFSEEIKAGRLKLIHKNFSEYRTEELGSFDLMLLDLGVSSPQLDQAERGFSFYNDGPLDMRMDSTKGQAAADVVNESSEEELIEIFKEYGEVHRPFRVVRAIVNDRKEKPYASTKELSSLIERVDGWHKKGQHPATKYFMALRLVVNKELENLSEALPHWVAGLNEGGRLAVISFHSLEDRIVKKFFRSQRALGVQVNKKVIQAEESERQSNPRARSAKLRIFEKRTEQENV